MMRLVFTMAVFGALVVTPAAAEDVPAPLDPAIAQCIRDNAAKVEAAVPDLNTAVDFLTTKVCAEPVARQNALTTKHGQERMAAHWKDICDKQKAAKPHGDKDLAAWTDFLDKRGVTALDTEASPSAAIAPT